ncbi:hypothetical protein [Fictibacillus phosphorivorans]|uniref:hypothetical protein n=1 Tax=Fictibacillus phosphorivorans TaxID=1221500 RepID=UPI00119FD046|nr:hypothetical protein [Fictibacillus phosphorivorans]
MKKLMSSIFIACLLFVFPFTAKAASLPATEKQVKIAAEVSSILHQKYTKNPDFSTLITTPYNKARYEVAKAKSMVDSLPNTNRKRQLLAQVKGYQKVVQNGNAYNNAVRTYPILLDYKKKHLDHYLSDEPFYKWRSYNYFNYKLSLLQPNYDKVYGKEIQKEFIERYLNPIKKSRDEVYYIISADTHLDRAEASISKNTEEAERRLHFATACINKIEAPKRKELLQERTHLLQELLEDKVSGINDTFYVTKNSNNKMKVTFNYEGEIRLWIADAEKYPTYESLKSAVGTEVYGHYSSNDWGNRLSAFTWTYRDWSSAYQMNIVHGYWDSYLDPINESNEKIIPVGKKIRIVLEVVHSDGEVIVREEVVPMTEELYRRSSVK